jgi:hypothetical protein
VSVQEPLQQQPLQQTWLAPVVPHILVISEQALHTFSQPLRGVGSWLQ